LAALARKNVQFNHLGRRVTIYEDDVRNERGAVYDRRYDLIVCNPPFFKIGAGKMNPAPELALARHELELTLEELLRAAGRLLSPTGRLALIHRTERLPECMQMLPGVKLQAQRLQLVHSYADAPAKLFLLECGKRPQALQVCPPLVVYQAPGDYTPALRQMMIE
jgi:tRNA1(Val) A37 N6-methylase TrmN6